jgi:hypothetical protein
MLCGSLGPKAALALAASRASIGSGQTPASLVDRVTANAAALSKHNPGIVRFVFPVIGCRHSGNRGLCHAAATGGLACRGRRTRRRTGDSFYGNADIRSVCNSEVDTRGGDDNNDDAMTWRSQKAPATPRPPPRRRPDTFSGACSGVLSRSQPPLRTRDPSRPADCALHGNSEVRDRTFACQFAKSGHVPWPCKKARVLRAKR